MAGNSWEPLKVAIPFTAAVESTVIGEFVASMYFKNTLDQINSEFSNKQNPLNISTVTFAHNCIIITKQTPKETEINNRPYRFKSETQTQL